MPPARERFLALLRPALDQGAFSKLTLGKYRGADPTLRNLFVRPVSLRAGPRLSFLWRHQTRDVTKNHPAAEALPLLEALIGEDFLDAHLFTPAETAQLECQPDGSARLRVKKQAGPAEAPAAHDAPKAHPIAAGAPWLRTLGVTNEAGRPCEGMAAKFRQIQKFAELFSHLAAEAGLAGPGLEVADMGAGKGYLTFALAEVLGAGARVRGVELRPELVDLCNQAAAGRPNLEFIAGTIDSVPLGRLDALIALHACDTATDDALARGIAAGARLLVVAPCCQKELRPQLAPPPVLAGALRHGIFQERQAEFATDALRAELLEWAGYRTKVFEFVSTEHTPKNLLIAGIKSGPARAPAQADAIRALAAFYGIRRHRLAQLLEFPLSASD